MYECETPIKPTPAAEPTENKLPPTPAERVMSSHSDFDMAGSVDKTAYIIGMLSMTALNNPMRIHAAFAPKTRNELCESSSKYPKTPKPQTHMITP